MNNWNSREFTCFRSFFSLKCVNEEEFRHKSHFVARSHKTKWHTFSFWKARGKKSHFQTMSFCGLPRRHRDPRHDMTSILFGSIPAKLRKAANDDVLRAQSARTWSRLCNDGGSTEMDASSFFCCLMFRSVESYPFFTWPGVRTPQSNDTFSSCEIWKVWKCGSIFHWTLGAAMSWTSKVWPDR